MNKLSMSVSMLSGILLLVQFAEAAQHLGHGIESVGITSKERGELISHERIGALTRDEIAASLAKENIPGVPLHGVRIYRVTYSTVDHHGEAVTASGAIAIPEHANEALPLLSFHHGTVVAHHRVPSVQGFDLVSMGLGASGYFTVLPDYLGLGTAASGFHPYVHAKSAGTAVVDMIRAAQEFAELQHIKLNEQLFLMGYSEGGYVTMAAHREIETYHRSELQVTASAPMAGPYNLSDVMVQQILEETAYPSPGYLPFTLLAYDMVYDIFEKLDEVILPEYIPVVESMMEGKTSLKHINKLLPAVPRHMLTHSFIQAFRDNPDHPLRAALRENDIHNWQPQAPMRLYHCVEDDQVSFKNAEMALKAYQNQGADHVELAKLTFGGHNDCAPPSLFLGKLWFDGFDEDASGKVFQANVQIIRAGAF